MRTRAKAAGVSAMVAAVVAGAVIIGPSSTATAVPVISSSLLVGPGGQIDVPEGASYPEVSDDGRYVAFRSRDQIAPPAGSAATQLPAQDFDLFGGPTGDLFLLDTHSTSATADDTLELVNVDSNEVGGGFDAVLGDLTPSGSHVVFTSGSNDLVPGDTTPGNDTFLRDRVSGTTERISVKSDGSQAGNVPPGNNLQSSEPSVSDDGLVVTFASTTRSLAPEASPVTGDTWQTADIYVRDRTDPIAANHTTTRLTVGAGGVKADGSSSAPLISPDGRYVYFTSSASNLVARPAP